MVRPFCQESFKDADLYFLAAATQVKFNRKSEYLIASAHDKDVKIWDLRVRLINRMNIIVSLILSLIERKERFQSQVLQHIQKKFTGLIGVGKMIMTLSHVVWISL